MNTTLKKIVPVLVALSVASGCTMAPKYERPTPAVPKEIPHEGVYQVKVSTNAVKDVSNLHWQEFFSDVKLQQMIGIALENNLDLRLAIQNVEYYRKMYNIQAEELFPIINGNIGMSQKRVPADMSSTGSRATVDNVDANLGVASWEIDFFGRIRSLKDAAMEEYLGTEQARRSAQIALISSVAQAYLSYAADNELLSVAQNLRDLYTESYNKIKRTYDLGLTTEIDLVRAKSQIAMAEGDIARYKQSVALDKNLLDILLGIPTPENLLPESLTTVQPTRAIAPALSSEVLLNRPDVLAAENQLRAANANIGAARAAFFPKISLTSAVGSASSDLSGLFKSGSGYWSYAPELVLPIFDSRTWSAAKAVKVKHEMVITSYQQSIQNAFREVADTLAVLGTVDDQLKAHEEYVASAKRTYELADYRYQKDLDSFLSVLDAERTYRSAQQSEVSLNLLKRVNEVKLYSVLGGGWVEPQTEENAN